MPADLAAIADGLMRRLGLTGAQAAVLSAGSEEHPKLLVYVFDKRVRAERLRLRRWRGIPVEVVRMEQVELHPSLPHATA